MLKEVTISNTYTLAMPTISIPTTTLVTTTVTEVTTLSTSHSSLLTSYSATNGPVMVDPILAVKSLKESNSLSLPVKILIPVAVCIFVAIVIVCWKYCKHENDEAKLAEVMTMMPQSNIRPSDVMVEGADEEPQSHLV
ncbi:hypothetical protein OS493_002316 [Desmophyllum pertusum]|uniref:Uncharacterized protein n=1 Tax=Desmophyllum pertusum TaxID=174260 RepID=A0A9X0CMI2_9CNID|nr:hypothetical protein OS493_002316 [Desmophyllum pertusum]